MKLVINDQARSIDGVDPRTPLLWFIRDLVGLKGTKFGCGAGLCGACTVHIDGQPIRSCITPLSALHGRSVTTIESVTGPVAEAVQAAWLEHNVPQCGYCQSGQIMSAIALLSQTRQPTRADVDAAMSGNICRCGTYPRIRAAIASASAVLSERSHHG